MENNKNHELPSDTISEFCIHYAEKHPGFTPKKVLDAIILLGYQAMVAIDKEESESCDKKEETSESKPK